MSLVDVGKPAIDYANSRLGEGLSLARRAQSVLLGMTAFAVVPDGAPHDRFLSFRGGGLGRCDIGEVAVLLSRRFPSSLVILELPLRRPTDPGMEESALHTLICGSEVYAACSLDVPPTQVEATLRAADPSFMYNAIVVDENIGGDDLSGCPTEWVEGGTARICAVLIGAYDGDGFVLAESPGETSLRDHAM